MVTGDCGNLLWVRCTKALDAVKAADLLLRDGNFPLVVLDLVLNASAELRKIPQTSWYRLQRLVETAPTAFLVLTRASIISSAQLKLSLDNAWTLADLEQDHLTARLTDSRETGPGRKTGHRGSGLMFATIYLPDFYLQAALAPSTGVAGKTCGLNRRSRKKGGDRPTQCRGRTNRCAMRNDAEPGFGAVSSACGENEKTFPGKTDFRKSCFTLPARSRPMSKPLVPVFRPSNLPIQKI